MKDKDAEWLREIADDGDYFMCGIDVEEEARLRSIADRLERQSNRYVITGKIRPDADDLCEETNAAKARRKGKEIGEAVVDILSGKASGHPIPPQ